MRCAYTFLLSKYVDLLQFSPCGRLRSMSNVQPYALMAGVPAKQIGWVCECGKRLDDTLKCECGRVYSCKDSSLLKV